MHSHSCAILKSRQFRHILKARINAHDELASALKSAYSRIKQSVVSSELEKDNQTNTDEDIKVCQTLVRLMGTLLTGSCFTR